MIDNRKEGETEHIEIEIENKPIREQRLEYEEQQRIDEIQMREDCNDWCYQHPLMGCCCRCFYFILLIGFVVFIVIKHPPKN